MPGPPTSFGSYIYGTVSGLSIQQMTDDMAVRQRTAETPGRDGDYSADGLLSARRFTMSGILQASTADALDTAWLAFRAAHRPGAAKVLAVAADRYRIAKPDGITKVVLDSMSGTWLKWDVAFYCSDPFDYSPTETTVTGLEAGGTVTNDGSETTLPVLTLVVSDDGPGGSITVANVSTSQSFVLTPSAPGTYEIDSGGTAGFESITVSDVDMSGEMTGDFLALAAGANLLTVTLADGATVSALSCVFRARWA